VISWVRVIFLFFRMVRQLLPTAWRNKCQHQRVDSLP
jgi:hypothetical protein